MTTLEKIEQSNQEQKEKEQLPILFIYRDNDLFREHIPKIASSLQAWGFRVETQVFPQKTEKREIKEWIEANQYKLEKKKIVSDRTALYQISEEIREKLQGQSTIFEEDLDDLFDQTSSEIILGNLNEEIENLDVNGLSEKEQNHKKESYRTQKVIERVFQNFFKKGGPMPQKLYILTRNIYDHEPFFNYEIYEKIRNVGENDPEEAERMREKQKQDAAEIIKKWLIGAGISENTINIEKNVTGKNRHDLVRPQTWFFGDRHNLSTKGGRFKDMFITEDDGSIIYNDQYGSCERANLRTFLLPLGDFYRTAKEQGFFDVDKQEFQKALNEKFKKLFVKQVEEK